MKARVVILVRNTSSWPVLHSCEVPWLYSKGYSSYRADTKLNMKWPGGNNSKSVIARVAVLVCDTSSWPVLHNYKVSSWYSKQFSSYRADMKLHLKPSRGNNLVWKGELSFLYATHRHDLFYTTVVYHDYIPKGIQVMERTGNLHLKPSRGNNSESMKARVVIFVRDTSSWPVLHSCEVPWLYSQGYSSYRAHTKLNMEWSRGNNSKSMIARVAVLVCDKSTSPVLHNCEVSSKYSKWYSSYWADTKMFRRTDGQTDRRMPASSLYPLNLLVRG